MKTTILLFCGSALFLLSSCGKKEAPPQAAGTAVVDTTQKAEAVAISDTNHHLFFKPEVGTTVRYRVSDKVTFKITQQGTTGAAENHSSDNSTQYWLRETVKSVGKDSSLELTMRIDSLELHSQEDTMKFMYSSGSSADRANKRYADINTLLKKEFTVKADKYGDLTEITDVKALAAGMLAEVPDSLRGKLKSRAEDHMKSLVGQFIPAVFIHCPTKALIKDTTWTHSSDINFPISQQVLFPVTVSASETVRGLEKRGDKVLAVLEDKTTTTPKQNKLENGPAVTNIDNFTATSHSIAHVEDATGLLYHRTMSDFRHFDISVENKEHPTGKTSSSQELNHTMVTEIVE